MDNRPQTPARQEAALTEELRAIRAELTRLNAHSFVRQLNSPLRMLGANFLRGIALGFGTVVGATIVVSLIAYMLAQVDYVPVLGEWANRLADEIQRRD
jgi:hypothetical protein